MKSLNRRFSGRFSFGRIIPPKYAQKIMTGVFWGVGILAIIILIVIIGYILVRGLPVVNLDFLLDSPVDSGKSGGIFPMIVSTIYVTGVAIVVATPLGVLAAVYLAEYAGENLLVRVIRFASETLASIPSIVFGL